MSNKIKTMAQKRARHFNESKTLLAAAMILFGVCAAFVLVVLWPQDFLVTVFNSRLAKRIVVDDLDFFTCSKDFVRFVEDEPAEEHVLLSFFVFSVANAADVLQRGFKPQVQERGPYGFVKNTYKYDVRFADDSLSVSFKEFSFLSEATDRDSCEKMFYRMQRDFLESDPCANDRCKCADSDEELVVVNPLFLKLLWQDSPFEMLAHFSVDVFDAVKTLLDEPFVEAVKGHLVSFALKEIYFFRTQMQAGTAMQSAFSFLADKYSVDYVLTHSLSEPVCNVSQYSIPGCPFNPYGAHPEAQPGYAPNASRAVYPSLHALFNASNDISLLNVQSGLPGWLGIAWYLGEIEFNSNNAGYNTVSAEEMQSLLEHYSLRLCELSFNTDADSLSAAQRTGCEEVVRAMAASLASDWLFPFSVLRQQLQKMAYAEFQRTHEPVVCEPLGRRCVWQYGHMRQYYRSDYELNDALTYALIDANAEISTNPNNLYKDVHAPGWYNVFLYREHVLSAALPDALHTHTYKYTQAYTGTNANASTEKVALECTNYANTIEDATLRKPAALWGAATGVSTVNTTELYRRYLSAELTAAEREKHFWLALNISFLAEAVYRQETDFHDQFVVRYLNRHKESSLTHAFVVGDWAALGYAQWGSGAITQALVGVRSTKQVVRDGMWRFGADKYNSAYMEYSSWCVLQGFPFAFIYSVEEARTLLFALAERSAQGALFRAHIAAVGSTLIGDGTHFVNDVGDEGDVTYIREANRGNFSCEGVHSDACRVLDTFSNSSAEQCYAVEALYKSCVDQYTFGNNKWINIDTCSEFQTSISSPSLGIQCGPTSVYGQTHPYRKSRGNVVFQMLYSLTLVTALQEGLWCAASSGCDFTWGGMFTTTTARQLLFSGFTEPSVLKYMDLKYAPYGISFECVRAPYDQCGVKSFHCDQSPGYGVRMLLHGNESFRFDVDRTSRDLFFAENLYVDASSGEVLFPLAHNATLAQRARERLASPQTIVARVAQLEEIVSRTANSTELRKHIVEVRNPFWSAFPAYTHNDSDYQRKAQCEKRVLSGSPFLFDSCESVLLTGRDDVRRALDLSLFFGNASIFPLNDSLSFAVNGSTQDNQQDAYLWSGFSSYPYSYLGRDTGANRTALKNAALFNKMLGLQLTLSQSALLYAFQREITVQMPIPEVSTYKDAASVTTSTSTADTSATDSNALTLPVRRLVEDANTWEQYRRLGTARDSYGMPYQVPKGFASLQRFASFPIFAETPHSYGNQRWGGLEYTFVSGTTQNEFTHRTFVDYDPVTGKAIRSALRQQISVRVEASAIFPNAFSSQQRCIVPTKSYAAGTGYGCFAYVPVLWYEEARNVKNEDFYQLYDHYYSRPDRGFVLTVAGLVIGALFFIMGGCLFVSEQYHRQRFKARVYVD